MYKQYKEQFYKIGKKNKYETTALIVFKTSILGEEVCTDNNLVSLFGNGFLLVKKGYYWDGASGPTIDTENTMRPSLLHDALYQLIAENKLNRSYRKDADKELYKALIGSGMSYIRAVSWYYAVRFFGGNSV